MSASPGIVIPDNHRYELDAFVIPACYRDDLESVLIPEGMIRDRVRRLAIDIHQTIGDQPLVVLCVLKGSYRFFTALVDLLTENRSSNCSSPLCVDFVRIKSYMDTTRTGQLELMGLASLDELRGKAVLVVDDIVDSGHTLQRLLAAVREAGASQVWTAVLLSKRVTRSATVPENFVAFQVADEFVVGFGLDYNQRFRDLNHICAMSQRGIARYKEKKEEET